jgi:hypothetical protein
MALLCRLIWQLLATCCTCCSGYRGVTVVHSDSDRIQAWRQQQADHSRSIECQVAAMAEGLAFDHNPYNVIIDKVGRGSWRC